jgi:hypothetical protein
MQIMAEITLSISYLYTSITYYYNILNIKFRIYQIKYSLYIMTIRGITLDIDNILYLLFISTLYYYTIYMFM